MAYEFRVRRASDYDSVPLGLGRTERQLKLDCCMLGLAIFRERLGEDHPLVREFEARAAAWRASLAAGVGTVTSVDAPRHLSHRPEISYAENADRCSCPPTCRSADPAAGA
jgi:hypothetical protein